MRLRLDASQPHYRVLDQGLDRHRVVHDSIDKGRVGAVLEQAANQIWQQVLMAADRGIHATRNGEIVSRSQILVHRFAHTVQALEFECTPAARELDDAGQRLGVVRGELRVERVFSREQATGAGEIGHIGRELAREQRVAAQPLLLRPLDFGIPIGAFDQTDGDAPLLARSHRLEPGDHGERAFLIRLHREPEAIPATQLRRRRQALEQIERRLEPVDLLGVDGHGDPAGARATQQLDDTWQQLLDQTLVLRQLVTRMKC